jgi:hypothetical protein
VIRHAGASSPTAEITQPEPKAIHSLYYGLSRDGLPSAAQVEYDRLAQEPGGRERWEATPDAQLVLIVTVNEIPG